MFHRILPDASVFQLPHSFDQIKSLEQYANEETLANETSQPPAISCYQQQQQQQKTKNIIRLLFCFFLCRSCDTHTQRRASFQFVLRRV